MEKELLYPVVCGEIDTDRLVISVNMQIENAFSDGSKCDRLCAEAYQAEFYFAEKRERNRIKILILLCHACQILQGFWRFKCMNIGLQQKSEKENPENVKATSGFSLYKNLD